MDWFRRQRRAKKVTNEEDAPSLSASEEPSLEETFPMSLPPPAPLLPGSGVPQPLLVELTSPPTAATLVPQPFKVEVASLPDKPDTPDVKGILTAEFAYIAQTTVHNSEDRVSSFFFVSAAAVISAAVGLKFDSTTPSWLYSVFGMIFVVLVILGWLAILQLALLRRGWFDSIRAMNRIKSYYYSKYSDAKDFIPSLPDSGEPHPGVLPQATTAGASQSNNKNTGVFHWMREPARFKLESVAFMRTVTIALIDWLFAASAVVLFAVGQNPAIAQQAGAMTGPLVTGALLGLAVCLVQLYSYAMLVQRD